MLSGNAKHRSTSVSSAYILKTDSLGNYEWAKIFNSGSGMSFQKTADNGFIITGLRTTGGIKRIHLTKTDINGCPVWVKTFNEEYADVPVSVVQTDDMGYMVAGNTPGAGTTNKDFYFIKTNTAGSTLCSNNLISINGDVSYFDFFEGPIAGLTGSIPTITIVPGVGINAVFLSNPICFKRPDIDSYISSGPDGNMITENNTEADSTNQRKAELIPKAEADPEMTAELFNVFPNPNNGGHFNISVKTEKAGEVIIVVYDQLGRESYSKVIIAEESLQSLITIDPSPKLTPGMYMINVTSGTNNFIKRIIVK
jgi:hypothetical protein